MYGLYSSTLIACPGTVLFSLRLFKGHTRYIQALAMSLILLSNLGNQETELTTNTHRNIFSSLILIFVLTALLLYVFVGRANAKRVGSDTKEFDCSDIKVKG